MSQSARTIRTAAPARTFASASSRSLQRKCSCGGKSGPDGECEECRKKSLQRKTTAAAGAGSAAAPPIVHQ
ncbi:MAG TPA: hypothetical protein VGO59_08390, partial [Verrucomicrobiae bacterium]